MNFSTLPIHAYREEIINALRVTDSLIISGETGCGKSTQVPIMIYEELLNSFNQGIIAITQPKRIAAMTLAKRVALELSSKTRFRNIEHARLGGVVGYSVRFDDKTSTSTKIKYLTDGMLLREYLSDHNLSSYSFICIDEVHERSMRTDILLGLLKDLQHKRKLKIILMSATMDINKFYSFFSTHPEPNILTVKSIHITGREYPVSIFYSEEPQKDYIEAAVITVFQIHFESPSEGDILLFLTGQEDIENVKAMLVANSPKDSNWNGAPSLTIVPIYAALPSHLQMEAFKKTPSGSRKVILATNIAESSVTIPGVKYVIDCGLSKSRVFHSKFGLESLIISPISKASAIQRTGRAGREGPGYCYRLYTEDCFTSLIPATIPEIQKANLSSIVLFLKASSFPDVLSFNYIDPPIRSSIASALSSLYSLGALNKSGEITPLGTMLAMFPVDPSLSKTIMSASELKCASQVISISALLSVENLIIKSKNDINNEDFAYEKVYPISDESSSSSLTEFYHSRGDHLTLLNIFESYDKSNDKKNWFNSHPIINKKSMLMAVNTRDQLIGYCKKAGIKYTSECDDPDSILRAFIEGFSTNIALLNLPSRSYKSLFSNQDVSIHPSSVIFLKKTKAKYLLFNELVFTSKCYMRGVSIIDGLVGKNLT